MGKVGRNTPCPCGSRRKYKKCCMMKRQTESFTRSLIYRTTDALIPEIMEFAEQVYPRDVIRDAWDEFYGQEIGFEENPFADMFIKWFLFQWIPEEAEGDYIFPSPHTIGASFLKARRHRMDSLSVRVLNASLSDPLTYWQVEALEPRRGVLLKDLLLGRERFVDDIAGSQQLRKWDIVFASLQSLDGIHVFNITGPFSLPPNVKTSLQETFSFDPDAPDALSKLFEYDLDLLIFYQDVIDALFSVPSPEIRNMDGKDLIATESVYMLEPDVRGVVVILLSDTEIFESFEEGGTFSDKFLWTGEPEKTSPLKTVIRGSIEVRQDRLVTECNSAERDHQLRMILKEVLGKRITHRKTSSVPMDFSQPKDISSDETNGPLNLDELPLEVRGQLIGYLENMYLQWADQSIPALENRTPRQAVKTAEGRAKVIDLINGWENRIGHMENPQFRFDFNRLRSNLGLPLE